jgi:glycosyltransferase involved in cell wall biosynthesis
MRDGRKIAVVIPALDEERAIGRVVDAIPGWVDEIVVVDNRSADDTAKVAAEHGARVVSEPKRGYGAACRAGVDSLAPPGRSGAPDVVVFVDGDFSDDPTEMGALLAPILEHGVDLVIGSRTLGRRERGSLTVQQRFGDALSCALIRLLYGTRYTDLGPFRAISHAALEALDLDDLGYGWTVQMQVRAARHGLRIAEVPVSYRRRAAGRSKVSGTIRGVLGAGTTILYVIFAEAAEAALSRRHTPASRTAPAR